MKKLLVVDIDDCVVRANNEDVGIWKVSSDGERTYLTTEEFSKDVDRLNPEVTYDYCEFRDPKKVRRSIMRGVPIHKNLKRVEKYIEQGYELCFLTARGVEDVMKKTMRSFFESQLDVDDCYRNDLCTAINDDKYKTKFIGLEDWEKKAFILDELCNKFDKVVFMDDDTKNCEAAKSLNQDNLHVIHVIKENYNHTRHNLNALQ